MTLQELIYAIEANTQGLNSAFPALEKLEETLEELDKAVDKLNKNFAKQMTGIGRASAGAAKDVDASTKKIEQAMKRQEASLISSQQKLISINSKIYSSGGPQKLVDANVQAFEQLQKVLTSTSTTTAEATLARAKYNAVLAESARVLDKFNAAQKKQEADQKAAETALLRQSNAVEAVRIKYLNLQHALESIGAKSDRIQALDKVFKEFEDTMNRGVLTSKQFSEAQNKLNAAFANIKRNSGFTKGFVDGFSEFASVFQVALGPLSGIASRLTALKTLAGSVGIGFAGIVTIFIALGVAIYKSIQAAIEFEKGMARINAILKTTGNSAIITSSQVEDTVRRIADATSESQDNVREAAAGLLTISGMNEELLATSLKAAQGLAIIGGSSIQTSFRNLAQVIQDPAQGLQTLTQYGVKFNAMEAEQIKLLEASGQHSEARALIIKKLGAYIEAATAQTDTFTGAWQRLKNAILAAGEEAATSTGIVKLMATATNALATDVDIVADAFSTLVTKLGGDVHNNLGSMWIGVKQLDSAFAKLDPNTEQLEKFNDILVTMRSRIREANEKKISPRIDLEEFNKARDALSAGNIEEALDALDKAAGAQMDAAEAAKNQADAVVQAGADYEKIREQVTSFTKSQNEMDASLLNIDLHWKEMRQSLLDAGDSIEVAEIKLRRLRKEVEMSNPAKGFLNTLGKQNLDVEGDIAATNATGAAKREAAFQQKLLNSYLDAGLALTDNYKQELEDLRKIGYGPLIDAIEAATKALDENQQKLANTEALKGLQDQLDLARKAAGVANQSQFAQSQAAAIAAKEQELLNRGVERGEKQWNDEIALVKQLGETNFAATLIQQQKELQDQIDLATAAVNASTMSALDEAKAIAAAQKQQELLNLGVKLGSDYMNEQVAAAQRLVELDFTKQSNEELKNMMQLANSQQAQLETMGYSEHTRENMVALAEKEYELAQKYGSLADERAQKELEIFKILQDRQDIVDHFKDIGDAIDSAFEKATDAVEEWAKTGKLDAKELVRSIAADFFKLEFKYLIADPIHDKLGSIFQGLLGGDKSSLPTLKGTDLLFKVPLPVTVVGGLGGLPGIGGGENVVDQVLKSVGIEPTPSVTQALTEGGGGIVKSVVGGTGKGDRVTGSFQKMIQDRIDSAFSGTSFKSAQDVIQDRIDSAFSGTGVTSSFDNIQKTIQNRIDTAFAPIGDAFDTVGKSATSMAKTITLSNKEITDLAKTVQSEVFPFKSDSLFNSQGHGVIDTILNRKASGIWGDTVEDVVNAKSQFSAISGNVNAVGNVANLPMPNSRTLNMVNDYLSQRAGGLASSVGGNLNYLNPFFASQNSLNQWGNSVVSQAEATGQIFGAGNAMHFHGTAPGMSPVSPYGIQLPGGMNNYSPFQSSLASGPLAGNTGLSSMFGGSGGLDTSGLTDSISNLNDQFSSLTNSVTDAAGSLTDSFSQATSAASNLATTGLDQTTQSLTNLSDSALSNQIAATAQTTTTTAQMGVTSAVTSAQIQALGSSASTAATQMTSGSIFRSAAQSGGVGSGFGGFFKSFTSLFGFAEGGPTGPGNGIAGFVHANEYVFDPESTRRIGVDNLEQLRRGARSGNGARRRHKDNMDVETNSRLAVSNSVRDDERFKILNLLDKNIVGDYLATREGEKIVMNIIRKNQNGRRA